MKAQKKPKKSHKKINNALQKRRIIKKISKNGDNLSKE